LPHGRNAEAQIKTNPQNQFGGKAMARKYGAKAQETVKEAMHKKKQGTLKSGKSGKAVKSRK